MTAIEVYARMLASEGLIVRNASDGRLHFQYEGDRYTLLTYADDQQFVGISATYRLPTGIRRTQALSQANELTRQSKVAKLYILPDRGVTIAVEQFVKDPDDLESILIRLLRLVQSVASNYFSRLANGTGASA